MTQRLAVSLIGIALLASAGLSLAADPGQDIITRTYQSQAQQSGTLPDQGNTERTPPDQKGQAPENGPETGKGSAELNQSAQTPADNSSDDSVKTGTLGNTSKTLRGRANATGSLSHQ